MNIYTNIKRIKKMQRIGMGSAIGGLVMITFALIFSFQSTNSIAAWWLALMGFLLSMFGTYHVNRWMRPPLAHEVLKEKFEGFKSRHLLFNYIGLVPHLLLTPKGLVAIKSKRYEGPVTYEEEKSRWKGKRSWWKAYRSGLAVEGLGDPSEEATKIRNDVLGWLQVNLSELADDVPVSGVIFFVTPETTLELSEPPVPVAVADTLAEVVRDALADERTLSRGVYKRLRQALEDEAEAVEASTD